MFKKLLSIAAMAIVGTYAANAQTTTLWESETEDGVLVDWGKPCYKISADDLKASAKPGDTYILTVSGVDEENGWPQVAIFAEYGGWPPLSNSGVGGQTYPLTVEFAITYTIWETISTEGLSFSGNGAYVSKVEHKVGAEISENTVWFGEKKCGWGNGVSLSKTIFENARPGDQLKVWTSDQSYQNLMGGWSGANFPAYASGNYSFMNYNNGVLTIDFPREFAFETEYDQDGTPKTFNIIAGLKENGYTMHGTTTITRIDYIPANYVTVDEVLDQPMAERFWVEAPIKVEEALLTGHLILTDGEKYILGGAFTEEAYALQSGDVIGAYWTVQNAELVGVCDFAIDNTVEIASPALVEHKYGEHAAAVSHGNYHKLTDVKYDGENIENTEEILFDAHEVLVGKSAGVYTLTGVWIKFGGSATTDDDDLGDDFNTPSGYVFVITAAERTGDLPTTGINAIESENAAAVYYNMQGVRVANPAQGGVYIVKQGNKISKKIIK